jgi:hypothetical protein
MSDALQGSNGFVNTASLPDIGQTIIVRWRDDGRVVHLHGVVTEVVPADGRVSIEHPPGVTRFLWFPEIDAGWREAVEADL